MYGRRYNLVTHHKPLTSILGSKKGVSAVTEARLQWWAILQSAYQYGVEFRGTRAHSNADARSSLPLQEKGPELLSLTQL